MSTVAMPTTQPTLSQFDQLPLAANLLQRVAELGYSTMTPVQAGSLPVILAGQDVVVQAPTGSGKTAAFALGLLTKLVPARQAPQALVMCPTRELAEQVAEVIRSLAKAIGDVKVLTLCGGVPARGQRESLQHGANILVGTPGRILDLLQQQAFSTAAIHTLVLDEADRMLEMGFIDDLKAIVKTLPGQRQTLLFSATYPATIAQLAQQVSQQAKHIQTEDVAVPAAITQRFYELTDTTANAVANLLLQLQPPSCMVFCNTKAETQNIVAHLLGQGISATALNGDLDQKQRDQAMIQFLHGSVRVLVATDVAARGVDVDQLPLVINVHMAHDLDTHTHRIGRTGRAGSAGLAITLLGAQDNYQRHLLEDQLDKPIQLLALPAPAAANLSLPALWSTLQITGGKKDKLRPGDIVGALTKDNQLKVDAIGKIKVLSQWSFVTVRKAQVKAALAILNNDKIKGKRFRARAL
ncbi:MULTISPECIES: ATP-dependent RNA helicase DbpA [Pseudidiomarina]|nr:MULTISPECIES: ATP-dependent RNA helicase DbpA [Pseudidiomarina]